MLYVITDKLVDGYWYGQYPTLELAQQEAVNYPAAAHILEYKATLNPKGWLPTGRSFPLKESNHES